MIDSRPIAKSSGAKSSVHHAKRCLRERSIGVALLWPRGALDAELFSPEAIEAVENHGSARGSVNILRFT